MSDISTWLALRLESPCPEWMVPERSLPYSPHAWMTCSVRVYMALGQAGFPPEHLMTLGTCQCQWRSPWQEVTTREFLAYAEKQEGPQHYGKAQHPTFPDALAACFLALWQRGEAAVLAELVLDGLERE